MDHDANQAIETAAGLRGIYGDAMGLAVAKEMTRLDRHCRDFIALSPFMVIGSANAAGAADVSPKGDAPGFVQVLDDRPLLIPDRPGNNRLDTLEHITENAEVATIFFVPGVKETLRINGRARIVADTEVTAQFEVNGKLPKTAILIEVREVFMHCAKALVRSRLWEGDYQVERTALPRYAEILADHADHSMTVDEIETEIEVSTKTRMW